MGRLSDIQWICYHGQCFRPPEALSSGLAQRLDTSGDGIISDRRGTGLTQAGGAIWMGENDITAHNVDEFEALIIDEFYEDLPLRDQRYLQVRVEAAYAAQVQKPVAEIRGEVYRAMALAKPRVEEILGEPITDLEWASFPITLRTRRTKKENLWAGFVHLNEGHGRSEVILFEHDEVPVKRAGDDQGEGQGIEPNIRLTVHELTHALLDVKALHGGIRLKHAGVNYPSWFCEGLAHLAEAKFFSLVERRFKVGQRQAQSLDGLENFQYDNGSPGREEIDRLEGFLAVKYLVQKFGLKKLHALIRNIAQIDQPFEASFEQAYGIPHHGFIAVANRWVKDQVRYERQVDGKGRLAQEKLVIEGRILWRKTYREGNMEAQEHYGYDDDGNLAVMKVTNAHDVLIREERYKNGGLSEVKINAPNGVLIREEQYEDGKLKFVHYNNEWGESRSLLDGGLLRRLKWITIDSMISGKTGRLLIDETYSGVSHIDDLSKGRLLERFYMDMSRGRPIPAGGLSVTWYRLEHYTYSDHYAIRRGIIQREGDDERMSYRLSDLEIDLDGIIVNLSLTGQELVWKDVFRECEPISCVRTENLTGGNVKEMVITDSQRRIIHRIEKNDLGRFSFPSPDLLHGYQFEVLDGPSGPIVQVKSPSGASLFRIEFNGNQARVL